MKTYGYAVAGYPTRQRPYGNFLKRYVLHVLSFVAENERTNIRQRQAGKLKKHLNKNE